jgi:hypothetical protein
MLINFWKKKYNNNNNNKYAYVGNKLLIEVVDQQDKKIIAYTRAYSKINKCFS